MNRGFLDMVSSRLLKSSTLVLILAYLITSYFPYKLHTKNADPEFSEALEFLPFDDEAFGPESITFDPAGDGPYAGVSDGRILKWVSHQRRWVDFAFTSPHREGCGKPHNHEDVEHICGRPLGLRFSEKTGELYIADAYMGLLVVGRNGGLATRVVYEVDGVPLLFTNGLDIDQESGLIYFTTSSSRYPRRNYMSVLLSHDNTGRLFRYNPETKQVTKLLDNLTFPNGVSLSKNNDHLLIAETTSCKILRYWLENTPKAGTSEVLTELFGFPDNIKRNSKGEYWIGMYSKRGAFMKWLFSSPWVGKSVVNLPFNAVKLTKTLGKLRSIGLAVKMDENGDVLRVLEDTSGKLKCVSEVVEKDGNLWFGSVILPFASLYKDYESNDCIKSTKCIEDHSSYSS